MRQTVRKSIKGARCVALNQSYKSTISEKVINIFSKEVDGNGNICEILEKDFEYTNKQSKQIENKYDSQIRGYRGIDQEERTEYINKKLNKPLIHKKLQKLKVNDVMMDFDAASLYPNGMWIKSLSTLKVKLDLSLKLT